MTEKAKVGLRYNQGKPKISTVPTKFIVNLANELSKEENDITYDTGDGEIHLQDALSLIPVEAIVELAKIYGKGCEKYEPENWKLGMNFSHCYNGAMRHLMLFKEGEEYDQESGLPHTLHAAWNCITLHWYNQQYNLKDQYDDLVIEDETTQDLLKGDSKDKLSGNEFNGLVVDGIVSTSKDDYFRNMYLQEWFPLEEEYGDDN